MEVDRESESSFEEEEEKVKNNVEVKSQEEVNYDDSMRSDAQLGKYKAIIFGSTGSLGTGVLKALKNSRKCEKILAITRRRIETHPKLINVIWEDFDDHLLFKTSSERKDEDEDDFDVPENLIELFRGYDICFNNCGIAAPKVNYNDYFKILHTYATRLAHICAESNVKHYYFSSTMESSWRIFHFVRNGWVQHLTEEYIKKDERITKNLESATFIKPPAVTLDDHHKRNKTKECCIRCWLGPCISLLFTSNYLIPQSVYGRGVVSHFEEKFFFSEDKYRVKEEEVYVKFAWDELWADDIVKFSEYF